MSKEQKSEEKESAVKKEEEKKPVKIIVNYFQRVEEEAKKIGMKTNSEKEVLKTLLEATFANYQKNKIDEIYFQNLYVKSEGGMKQQVASVLAKIQGEIKNQENYMDYLIEKLNK